MANIIVSACLLGLETRYKGDGCLCERLLALSREHTLIPVCPEQLGGLATPRDPSEIAPDGRVMSCAGQDVTAQYEKGARCALAVARTARADFAILKSRSPSCGKGIVYDGSFTGRKIPGTGVACSLLLEHGIPVYTEEDEWPVP